MHNPICWPIELNQIYHFPQWDRLKDPVVWMDAAGQIFYSLGVGFGTLTLFSTGHKPNNNFYMDAVMSALGNCGTSLWASIIMFSLFGFKASYEVKDCEEMSRNASFGNNGSNLASCSKEKIFQQVGKPLIIYEIKIQIRLESVPNWKV